MSRFVDVCPADRPRLRCSLLNEAIFVAVAVAALKQLDPLMEKRLLLFPPPPCVPARVIERK